LREFSGEFEGNLLLSCWANFAECGREICGKNTDNTLYDARLVIHSTMRFKWCIVVAFGLCMASGFAEQDGPLRFNAKGEMLFPEHYREWVWLSSGLGMSYSAEGAENPNPKFDNVFVSPTAYRTFMDTGTWPNGSVFMLEIRGSRHQGSINQAGHYQGELLDVEAHVKKADGVWAFYGFGSGNKPARVIASDASCYSCHQQHGAVDTTFVQFYPTLLNVAREKKTLNEKKLVENNK
jgi:hypothetical protein